MQLRDFVTAGMRVVDVGAEDPNLARDFAAAGSHRYLALVPPASYDIAVERAGVLADRFQRLDRPTQATDNSADLLILRGPFAALSWSIRDVGHVRYLAVEARPGLKGVELQVARGIASASGRASYRGRLVCGELVLDVLEIATRRAPTARRYLSPVWGVPGFTDRLRSQGVRYAVLRWFDTLPLLSPGEDLDLLVADEDLAAVTGLLDEEPGTIPVDLYSVSGTPGSDYRGMAYYPPALARELLGRAVVHPSGCRVPAGPDHLHSLAYHAVYHKGLRSGLANSVGLPLVQDPEHDYAGALASLAAENGVDLPVTLEGIDAHLAEVGWRPPPDTLRRLASTNPWVAAQLGTTASLPALPELAAFLVRERTLKIMHLADVQDALEALGFEVVEAQMLDEFARRRCTEQTRGGNWGRGPFPRSGGDPVAVVVALHYGPRAPGPALRDRYPRLSNGDVLEAKLRIRDLVAQRLPVDQRFNPVHSSDDEMEGWEYVDLALPGRAALLRAEVARRRADYRNPLPVIRELSHGRRAKVEVVRFGDGLAVRKTFAPTALRHMQRELDAVNVLGPCLSAVPPVLDRGPNWFLCPYYDDRLKRIGDKPGGPLVPLRVVRQMLVVLREIHALGFDLLDAKPQNFVLDPRHGLKLVDYEFFHRLPEPPPPFQRTYSFAGIPEHLDSDVPVGEVGYEVRWRPFTGLPLDTALGDRAWRQHLHRLAFRARRAAVGRSGFAHRAGRQGRVAWRAARRAAGRSYRRWARQRASGAYEAVA